VEEWCQGGSRKQRQSRRRESAEVAKGENNRVRTGSPSSQEGHKKGRPEGKSVMFGPTSRRRSHL